MSGVDNGRADRVRILHVVQNLNYGGMERLIGDLVLNLDDRMYDSRVLVLEYIGRFGEELERRELVHRVTPQSRLSLLRPVSLTRAINALAPDVVHAHSGVWYKAARAARAAGVPTVMYTEHGRRIPDPWLGRTMDRLASTRTDVAVGVSDHVGRILKEHIVAGDCRVRVIPNGINTERYNRPVAKDPVYAELSIPPGSPVLGSVGRLEPVKAFDVMLRAFTLLLERWRAPVRPVLLIIGDGSEREALERLARISGIVESVRFLGWRDDIERLLSSFDLFTMTSLSEGTSVSLLEAMASGICPVVTQVGGNPDVLGEELRHRLVAQPDPRIVARAWETALAEPDRREMDGRKARRRVRSFYSISSMVQSYDGLYRSALRL